MKKNKPNKAVISEAQRFIEKITIKQKTKQSALRLLLKERGSPLPHGNSRSR